MLPLLLNKKAIEEKDLFKDYCYIISKYKNNLMATELQNVLETKLRNEELKNLEGLFILDNKGNLYKIKNLEHDENFNLEIKLKKEEIDLEEIKQLFINNISELINNKKDKIDEVLKNNIKEKIESIDNKKELFDLLFKEKENTKKSNKITLEKINSIKTEEEKEFKLKEKILTIILLLFLSYVIFSSWFITVGFICIILMFVLYIIIDKFRENDFKLKEKGILVDIESKIIKENDKKRMKFNENTYFCTQEEYYKVTNKNYNIKLTKVSEENYFKELKYLLNSRLNEYINIESPYKEIINQEIKKIKELENKDLLRLFFKE